MKLYEIYFNLQEAKVMVTTLNVKNADICIIEEPPGVVLHFSKFDDFRDVGKGRVLVEMIESASFDDLKNAKIGKKFKTYEPWDSSFDRNVQQMKRSKDALCGKYSAIGKAKETRKFLSITEEFVFTFKTNLLPGVWKVEGLRNKDTIYLQRIK